MRTLFPVVVVLAASSVVFSQEKKPEIVYHKIREAVKVEELTITVADVLDSVVPLKKLGDLTTTDEKYTLVLLSITNNSEKKKYQYTSPGNRLARIQGISMKLVDEVNNKYLPIEFGIGTTVTGATEEASIYPGKSISDLLVFERGTEKIEFLRLSISGKMLELPGEFHWQFNRKKDEPKPVVAEVKPAEIPPDPAKEKAEKAAQALMNAAKTESIAKKPGFWRLVISKYPTTKAAVEARAEMAKIRAKAKPKDE